MHTSSQPLVSIVTPAYNEEEHLSDCVQSVLAQTYSNWDYTIVNNCSTDGTISIAQEFAAKDPRIRFLSNPSLIPAIANLNLAFRQISPLSKYTKMVLADDWIFPDCLERMVALMEKHPSIGIVGAYGLADRLVLWTGLPYPSECVDGRIICRDRLLGAPYVFGSPTSVLFRSDLVRSRDPFYNPGYSQADSETCFELLKHCDFGFVHQVLTFSRDDRPNSRLQESRKLNTGAAGTLHELVVFGPHYLTHDEYLDCFKTTMAKYYEFLAAGLVHRRDPQFWDFHRRELKKAGVDFSYFRLAGGAVRKTFRKLLLHNGRPQWGL
jgi:glycosyltransferase involved in cell wall biosynthesis